MVALNPMAISRMMKQFGIKQESIDANRVIIECEDYRLVIDKPEVSAIVIQGQKMFQIVGEAKKEALQEIKDNKIQISEEDIKIVMEKTGCEHDEAEQKLKEADGDIAKAILTKLS